MEELLRQTYQINNQDDNDEAWREDLPEPLSQYKDENLQRMQCRIGPTDVHIYIIGTSHVCPFSPDNVHLLLETVHPHLIFLEKCEWDYAGLIHQAENQDIEWNDTTCSPNWFSSDFLQDVWLYQYGLRALTNTTSCGEFDRAYQYWQEDIRRHRTSNCTNSSGPPAILVLGDRPLEITDSRVAASTTFLDKCRRWLCKLSQLSIEVGVLGGCSLFTSSALCYLLSSRRRFLAFASFAAIVHGLTRKKKSRWWVQLKARWSAAVKRRFRWRAARLLYKNNRSTPNRYEKRRRNKEQRQSHFIPLIAERDVYMACKLYQAVQLLFHAIAGHYNHVDWLGEYDGWSKSITIVTVVGAAHVMGVRQIFGTLTENDALVPDTILDSLLDSLDSSNPVPVETKASLARSVLTVSPLACDLVNYEI